MGLKNKIFIGLGVTLLSTVILGSIFYASYSIEGSRADKQAEVVRKQSSINFKVNTDGVSESEAQVSDSFKKSVLTFSEVTGLGILDEDIRLVMTDYGNGQLYALYGDGGYSRWIFFVSRFGKLVAFVSDTRLTSRDGELFGGFQEFRFDNEGRYLYTTGMSGRLEYANGAFIGGKVALTSDRGVGLPVSEEDIAGWYPDGGITDYISSETGDFDYLNVGSLTSLPNNTQAYQYALSDGDTAYLTLEGAGSGKAWVKVTAVMVGNKLDLHKPFSRQGNAIYGRFAAKGYPDKTLWLSGGI